jgi:adenylate cyclase
MADSMPTPGSEEWWRTVLTDPKAHFEPFRRYFLRIPSAPHCKLCGAPFKGIGGAIMGPLGFRPWAKNPSLCRACIMTMNRQPPGGAEISCSLLFADVRQSTGIAERAGATEFAALLRRFYAVGSQAIIDEDGIVDKFVGDEVVGLFIPVYAGRRHAARAVRSARRLLSETGHGSPEGPWLDIGIGIHAGVAFVGTVAVGGEVADFTALGDAVNTAARLASEARAGEVLVSDDAIANAARGESDLGAALERRELSLRGREARLAVRVADHGSIGSLIQEG